jgi:hypothetical protein
LLTIAVIFFIYKDFYLHGINFLYKPCHTKGARSIPRNNVFCIKVAGETPALPLAHATALPLARAAALPLARAAALPLARAAAPLKSDK